jgi:EAL domain-containing protein (putative c-di-GMP-specific phosphodiesterase class I)
MLSLLPIDALKMDMKFIQNVRPENKDFRMIELILGIAEYLGVPVIAEGVETKEQLELLKNAGCSLVQGYYFSKPIPPDQFEQLIRNDLSIATDKE